MFSCKQNKNNSELRLNLFLPKNLYLMLLFIVTVDFGEEFPRDADAANEACLWSELNCPHRS